MSLNFGSQGVNTTSPAQSIVLSNYGKATLNITGITASANFAETDNCGTSLASAASCTISVTFSPSGVVLGLVGLQQAKARYRWKINVRSERLLMEQLGCEADRLLPCPISGIDLSDRANALPTERSIEALPSSCKPSREFLSSRTSSSTEIPWTASNFARGGYRVGIFLLDHYTVFDEFGSGWR